MRSALKKQASNSSFSPIVDIALDIHKGDPYLNKKYQPGYVVSEIL